jgi:LacI family transcriptional regulator
VDGGTGTVSAVARRKRATIRQVAEATGLSPAAVSYALRGVQTSEETQARVRRAAEELGYQADPIARALAGGPTGLVGVLSGSLEDLGEQRFVEAVGRQLRTRDLHLLVTDAHGDPSQECELAGELADRRVDGLIVSPLDPSHRRWREIAARLPVVTVGDALAGAATVGELIFDNREGVSRVLHHLHELGHRTLAALTPSRPTTPDRPAEVVVAEVSEALGLATTMVRSPHSIDGARAVARRVLAAEPRPTALFCLSDSIACGVYGAARDLALRIPDEVSVIGYDDHPLARVLTPELSSVSWGAASVARVAADLLADAAAGQATPRRISVSPTLLPRGSVARLGRRR